jgi:hypothetical protein
LLGKIDLHVAGVGEIEDIILAAYIRVGIAVEHIAI